MSKQFWGIIGVVVLIFVGIFAINSSNSNSSNKASLSQHIEGKGQAHVSLVEYGDYQCPYCGIYYPVVKQIQAQYSNQITFQFRNFPLTSLHPNAFAGARAAEAAALQGKFWQMHDLLYQENEAYYNGGDPKNSWIGSSDPEPYFVQFAKTLGLNVAKFQTDYASNQVDQTIQADSDEASTLGLDATPTFFLDGKKINVGESVSEFQTLINNAIKQKAGKAAGSTTSAGSTSQTTNTTKSSTTTNTTK